MRIILPEASILCHSNLPGSGPERHCIAQRPLRSVSHEVAQEKPSYQIPDDTTFANNLYLSNVEFVA